MAATRKRNFKKFWILIGIIVVIKRKNILNHGNKSNLNLRSRTRAKYLKLNLRARSNQRHVLKIRLK